MALSMAISFNFHLIFTFESALTRVAFLSVRDSTPGFLAFAVESDVSSADDLGTLTREESLFDRGSFRLRGSPLLLGSLRRGSLAALLGSV